MDLSLIPKWKRLIRRHTLTTYPYFFLNLLDEFYFNSLSYLIN